MRTTSVVVALILIACPVAIDAGNPQTTAIMKISGMPGQISIPVEKTDWSQIPGLPDPTAPRTTRSTSPLSARSSSSLASRGGTLADGGGGVGKVDVQDLSITKWVDAASPNLMTACANGQHFDQATITVRHAGEDVQEYLIIELTNVVIESVNTGSSGGEDRPTENVTVSFGEVSWDYQPVQSAQRPTPSFSRATPTYP